MRTAHLKAEFTGMLLIGIPPWPNCHDHNDSNDDEEDNKTAAHPLAS